MLSLFESFAPLQARSPDTTDRAFLGALYASTRPDLHSSKADPARVSSLMAMQQRLQTADYQKAFPAAQYILVTLASQRIGHLVINQTATDLRLIDIALCETVRGQGIGTHILRTMQNYAVAKKITLSLAVHRRNADAQRLYLRLGFQILSSKPQADQLVWNNAAQPDCQATSPPSSAAPTLIDYA